MRKLLSLVLSVSILASSITPALGQAGPAGRGVVKGLRRSVTLADRRALSARVTAQVNRQVVQQAVLSSTVLQSRILSGNVSGLARQILKEPLSKRAPILRNEFVALSLMPGVLTPAQRAQAVKAYQIQLKSTKEILSKTFNLNAFLNLAKETPNAAHVTAVRNILADASALGLVGTREDAPILLDFYQQAQGTQFEDIAALITARGLLRMQAYEELGALLGANVNKECLTGTAAYIRMKGLPVEVPSSLQIYTPKAANEKLAAFLGVGFMPNRIHADTSLRATEEWIGLSAPRVQTQPAQPQAKVSTETKAPLQPVTLPTPAPETVAQQGQPTQPQALETRRAYNIQKIFKRNEEFDRKTFPVEIMDVTGQTAQTPLTFSIGGSLSSNGYDRVIFREDPGFENKYIIELHDHGKEPIKMGHFYMALYNNDVGALVAAAQKAGIKLRLKLEHTANVNNETITKPVYDKEGNVLPLEVSVQLGKPLWAREMSQAMVHWMEERLGISGTYTQHLLADAKLVLRNNGEIWMQLPGSQELTPLPEEYYVRLPKHQVQNVVALLPYVEGGQTFNIVLSPTSNRVNMVARDASLTNVSLGKTMGSVVHNSLDMGEANAKTLMMGINYVMPGFASLMTPALKKYGEKNLLTLSLGMSVGAGVLATLGGFNGFVEGATLGPIQKGLFVGALLLMSGASIIKQLVSNMLIRANRGEVVLSSSAQKATKAVTAQEIPLQGMALLSKRFKEFFTKKSEMSLRDLVLYNKGFVNKNIGTLLFLASPFLIQYGTLAATGIDLGIDYSASFPLYAAYSSYVMWKVLRSKLRDAYTAKNLLQSQQMLANMLKTGTKALAEGGTDKIVVDDVARSFKDSLDALAFAHIKMNPAEKKKEFYQEAKEHILVDLENSLVHGHSITPAQAHELVEQVAASIKVQENNLGNMRKMLKAPGVGALATAMTLATVHEFVISSSFAGTMKDLIAEGELANFLMATSLYVPLIIGRLGGNWISRRISPDTMYLFCSTLSAVGTAIMATAGTSVPLAITGAAIASLGVGNFFTQMYDYIMNKYPKQNREISSILALTMGVAGIGAIPAGYITTQTMGAPLDLWYAGAALAVSLVLTPGMMMNSSLIKGVKQVVAKPWNKFKANVKKWFNADTLNKLPPPGGFANLNGQETSAEVPAH